MVNSTDESNFSQLGVIPSFCVHLQRFGWSQPTPVQKFAIPESLSGKDVVGLAETGSGKTGAFLIPILQKWILAGRPQGFGLILAPTRELVRQITEVASTLGTSETDPTESVVVLQLLGGESIVDQALRLAWHRHHIIVATPGRLVEHMSQSSDFARQQLSKVQHLVLDEADRMLNMAFADDIDTILGVFESVNRRKARKKKRPPSRLFAVTQHEPDQEITSAKSTLKYPHPQTYLYSATMTRDVVELKRLALSADAVIVNASRHDVLDGSTPMHPVLPFSDDKHHSIRTSLPASLLHFYHPVRLADKPAILLWLLQSETFAQLRSMYDDLFKTNISCKPRALVFCRRCLEAELVGRFLHESGFGAVAPLTGQIPQKERKKNLSSFLSGEVNILVATDVASRGLDIPNVELVVNYSVPLSEELYRHRVGRTARSGTAGIAVTLVTRDCASQFLELESTLAPYLPRSDEKQLILRWPVAVPGSSGPGGMQALRRQADTAWRKAAKYLRTHSTLKDAPSDDEDSETASSVSESDDLSSDEDDAPDESYHQPNPKSAPLDLSGSAGLRAIKQARREAKAKRRRSVDRSASISKSGWAAGNGEESGDDGEQDNLRFAESFKSKHPKLDAPKR